jgi:hypothetical protein
MSRCYSVKTHMQLRCVMIAVHSFRPSGLQCVFADVLTHYYSLPSTPVVCRMHNTVAGFYHELNQAETKERNHWQKRYHAHNLAMLQLLRLILMV